MRRNKSRTFLRTAKSRGQLPRQRSVWDKLLFLIILLAVGGAIFLYPGYRFLRTYIQRVEGLSEDNRVLHQKIRELEEEIEVLEKDSFYLEKLARELGLIKEGEVVYKIREEESESQELESSDD